MAVAIARLIDVTGRQGRMAFTCNCNIAQYFLVLSISRIIFLVTKAEQKFRNSEDISQSGGHWWRGPDCQADYFEGDDIQEDV